MKGYERCLRWHDLASEHVPENLPFYILYLAVLWNILFDNRILQLKNAYHRQNVCVLPNPCVAIHCYPHWMVLESELWGRWLDHEGGGLPCCSVLTEVSQGAQAGRLVPRETCSASPPQGWPRDAGAPEGDTHTHAHTHTHTHVHMKSESVSCSVLSDFLWPHRL